MLTLYKQLLHPKHKTLQQAPRNLDTINIADDGSFTQNSCISVLLSVHSSPKTTREWHIFFSLLLNL